MDRAAESLAAELPELLGILEEMNSKVSLVNDHVCAIQSTVEAPDFNTEKGVSLLELKFHMLLCYLIDLVYVVLLKTEGKSINGSSAVQRLVETRIVLEKIRPLDQKLRYQIDKLVRIATTGPAGAENDPLRFKPNPNNLVSKLSEDDDDNSDEDSNKQKKTYVPPKVSAVPYDDYEGGIGGRQRKMEQRLKQMALRSELVKELRDEYLDLPQEMQNVGAGTRSHRVTQEQKAVERYEEDNLIRLPQKKKRQDMGRESAKMTDDLTDFSGLEALTRDFDDEDGPTGKGHKHSSSKRGGSKTHHVQKTKKGDHINNHTVVFF